MHSRVKLFKTKRLGKDFVQVKTGVDFFDFDGNGLDLVLEMVP